MFLCVRLDLTSVPAFDAQTKRPAPGNSTRPVSSKFSMIDARAADAPVLTTAGDVDPTALKDLYRSHASRIYSPAYRFVGNAADAEELLQEIFLHAHRRLASFKQRSALSTWLHRLAGDAALADMDEASAEAEPPVAENVTAEARLPTGAAHFGIGAPDNGGWASGGEEPAGDRPDETLAAELDRVRAEADQTLAVQLDAAEERHRADIVRLEAEAGERADAAAREAQTVAGAQANEALAAESDPGFAPRQNRGSPTSSRWLNSATVPT